MKTFTTLVLLALLNVAVARYFARSARQYDEYIRDLLMYRDPEYIMSRVKSSSGWDCQTACEKKQVEGEEIYTCVTGKSYNDPCSPDNETAYTGEKCWEVMGPYQDRDYGYSFCFVKTATGPPEKKRCSMYRS